MNSEGFSPIHHADTHGLFSYGSGYQEVVVNLGFLGCQFCRHRICKSYGMMAVYNQIPKMGPGTEAMNNRTPRQAMHEAVTMNHTLQWVLLRWWRGQQCLLRIAANNKQIQPCKKQSLRCRVSLWNLCHTTCMPWIQTGSYRQGKHFTLHIILV